VQSFGGEEIIDFPLNGMSEE